jgi:L-alanine-DL-glutamate epimerase-like enolase superfamily enzyme
MSDTTIDGFEAWYLRVPLSTPIRLGDMVIAQRDFVVVRIRTVGGLEGVAYSLTRGAPLDLVLTELVGPRLLGREALDPRARSDELVRGMVNLGAVGLVGRAISLVDIALWDILGQAAGMPVWRLLGGARASAPVLLVAPYAAPDEADEAYAERIAAVAARGYRTLKLYPMADPAAMRRRLAAIRAATGPDLRLVIDMAWSFRTAQDAIDAVRSWEEHDLTWVEDPFPADDWASIKQLADAVDTPIAVGDEVSVRGTTERLITERAVDVLRLDVTSIGGFAAYDSLRDQAQRAGIPVSPHAYGEIHQHCIFAWPGTGPVEIFAPDSPTWGTSRFLARQLDAAPGTGMLDAPKDPGLGLVIDWDAVERVTIRHTVAAP